MKQIFIFFFSCFVLLNPGSSFAQQDRIKAGYGYLSAPMIITSIAGEYITLLSFKTLDYDDPESGGSLFLEYNHGLSERFSLTGILVHERFTRKIFSQSGTFGSRTYTGIDEKTYFTTVMAGFDFKYLTIGDVTVSLSLTLGAGYVKAEAEGGVETSSDNDWLFAFQTDLIKLHYGEKLGIDAGLGLGFKGFLTVGVSYSF